MMSFLLEYGLFLAKAITVVAAFGAMVLLAVGLSRKGPGEPGLQIEKLNDKYRDLAQAVKAATMSKDAWKKEKKDHKKKRKEADKAEGRRRVFVLDFKGDIRASAVTALREEITAILSTPAAGDEVVLRLENFGGAVHEHGLAASQLQRLRDQGIRLTAIVDKGAASGGYLMACVADRIVAAPFAVVGSIGVIAQIPNFSRLLEAQGVDFEQITAGKYKRTVTMFGRTTEADREKLKEELEDIHTLFKQVVGTHRPQLDLDKVATGEHWYGTRALELKLVDELGSSDDYLLRQSADADLYHLTWKGKQSLQQRLFAAVRHAADGAAVWLAERNQDSRYR
jgi:serine protease SohB